MKKKRGGVIPSGKTFATSPKRTKDREKGEKKRNTTTEED